MGRGLPRNYKLCSLYACTFRNLATVQKFEIISSQT